jgi:hypothetical protein
MDGIFAGRRVRTIEVSGLKMHRHGPHGDVIDIYPTEGNKLFSMREMPDGEMVITSSKRGPWEQMLLLAAKPASGTLH